MITTERLRLRRPRLGDTDLLVALRTDPDVRAHLGGPMRNDDAARLAAWNIAAPDRMLVVVRSDTDRPIGIVLVHEGHGATEVSYQFLSDSWGHGYAGEAVRCVIQHTFDSEPLDELIAVTQTANVASCRLLERLGMTAAAQFDEFGAPQTLYRLPRGALRSP